MREKKFSSLETHLSPCDLSLVLIISSVYFLIILCDLSLLTNSLIASSGDYIHYFFGCEFYEKDYISNYPS